MLWMCQLTRSERRDTITWTHLSQEERVASRFQNFVGAPASCHLLVTLAFFCCEGHPSSGMTRGREHEKCSWELFHCSNFPEPSSLPSPFPRFTPSKITPLSPAECSGPARLPLIHSLKVFIEFPRQTVCLLTVTKFVT